MSIKQIARINHHIILIMFDGKDILTLTFRLICMMCMLCKNKCTNPLLCCCNCTQHTTHKQAKQKHYQHTSKISSHKDRLVSFFKMKRNDLQHVNAFRIRQNVNCSQFIKNIFFGVGDAMHKSLCAQIISYREDSKKPFYLSTKDCFCAY